MALFDPKIWRFFDRKVCRFEGMKRNLSFIDVPWKASDPDPLSQANLRKKPWTGPPWQLEYVECDCPNWGIIYYKDIFWTPQIQMLQEHELRGFWLAIWWSHWYAEKLPMPWWFSFRIPSWFIRGDHRWDVRLSECCNLAKKNDQGREVVNIYRPSQKKNDSEMTKIYIYTKKSCLFSFPAKTPRILMFLVLVEVWRIWKMYSKNTSRYNNHLIDSSTGTIFVNDAKKNRNFPVISNRGDVWSGMVARFLVSSANCSSCSCLQISGT